MVADEEQTAGWAYVALVEGETGGQRAEFDCLGAAAVIESSEA